MIDLIEEIEDWVYGHKARCVHIVHENGYGSSVWVIQVESEFGKYDFWEGCFADEVDPEDPTILGYPYYEELGLKEFTIKPANGENWAGLKTTLKAALNILKSEAKNASK